MKVVITGASSGIGRAVAQKFLHKGHQVIGIDVLSDHIDGDTYKPSPASPNMYTHYIRDVSKDIPDIDDVDILINNAGVQNSGNDIDINLKGTINCT